MSTPTQLTLYNGALFLLEQPELADVDENKEARHVLDHFYEDKDAIEDCLEMGNWNFATRTAKLTFNSDVEPDFGLQRAFTKPTDWVKTVEVSADEYFTSPMTDSEWKDEQSYFFAEVDEIYIRYVSDDSSYGKDFSLWPKSFESLVEHFLAHKISPRVNSKMSKDIEKKFKDAAKNARSKDALQEGVKFPPQTGWQGARRGAGHGGGRRDGGGRSSLTG